MTKQTSAPAHAAMAALTLGKSVDYSETYTATLLQAVPRQLNRDEIGLTEQLPFHGIDIWNGYELSWLNAKGKPNIAIMQAQVPADSPNLIESKSFKLYLNSYNQSRFNSIEAVTKQLQQDLSFCAGKEVKVSLLGHQQFNQLHLGELAGEVIDEQDICIDSYQLNPAVLTCHQQYRSETLVSHLLKSNCLITNQPDWGSVQIRYEGKQIDKEGLLRYLISFRQHNEFHEQCVERIFCDLLHYCKPDKLTVLACYTRRGGLDINPFRSNFEQPTQIVRLARQ